MKYSKVFIESFGYELAPVVVTTSELEERLGPLYKDLRIPMGQLAALTGIVERRWWEPGFQLSKGAALAAGKALKNSSVMMNDISALIYSGVCRESFEPATACRVANSLGLDEDVLLFDLSNACLGVLNGIVEIANMIELGQIRAGLVVSCETAREVNETMIERMLKERSMELFKTALATLTGGSGAVAVLLTDGSFSDTKGHRLLGGTSQAAPRFHDLCRWQVDAGESSARAQYMRTDSIAVMKNGVELGNRTWKKFLSELAWKEKDISRVICHQVGSAHQDSVLAKMGISREKDYTTFEYLGNIGTVSLPITAAIAGERGVLEKGDNVGFLGIGSGLNSLMLGIEW
ncbi:MAG: 3-oxoacyl-ACP synthase III [Nitrospinota bacterium]